jgi:uncharacterized RDD family membrane protein YckC
MDKVSTKNETWPTEAPVDEQEDAPQLATRVSRLFAALVDGFFFGVFGVAATFAAMQVPHTELALLFGTAIAVMGLWAAINVFLLVESSQTIGKSIVGLRIERTNGDRAGFLHAVVLRYGVMALFAAFLGRALGDGASSLFWLVDALFIFGAAQRCVHDLIADTRVVDV